MVEKICGKWWVLSLEWNRDDRRACLLSVQSWVSRSHASWRTRRPVDKKTKNKLADSVMLESELSVDARRWNGTREIDQSGAATSTTWSTDWPSTTSTPKTPASTRPSSRTSRPGPTSPSNVSRYWHISLADQFVLVYLCPGLGAVLKFLKF